MKGFRTGESACTTVAVRVTSKPCRRVSSVSTWSGVLATALRAGLAAAAARLAGTAAERRSGDSRRPSRSPHRLLRAGRPRPPRRWRNLEGSEARHRRIQRDRGLPGAAISPGAGLGRESLERCAAASSAWCIRRGSGPSSEASMGPRPIWPSRSWRRPDSPSSIPRVRIGPSIPPTCRGCSPACQLTAS